MKKLLIIPYLILWVFYFMLTMNARSRYMRGKGLGYHCVGQATGLTSTMYYFDHTKKPEREYLTFKEFLNRLKY